MKYSVKEKKLMLASFLMIGIMIALISNQAIFLHVHKLSDGTTISHAHPYNSTKDNKPFKKHDHSNAELLILQTLDSGFIISLFTVALFLFFGYKHIRAIPIAETTTILLWVNSGRAPPFS